MNALHVFTAQFPHALLMAFGMFWHVIWSLILGFFLSACIQVLVPQGSLQKHLGQNDWKSLTLATAFGAASSSCSYASASISNSLFKKGAGLIPSLAFLLASTNLVIELGIVLYLLMGWQFMVGEWLGGIVMVICMSLLVRLTYPTKLIEAARQYHPAQKVASCCHVKDVPTSHQLSPDTTSSFPSEISSKNLSEQGSNTEMGLEALPIGTLAGEKS